MATVVMDAGHGGSDFGATYLDRMEKNDTLRLALSVGSILVRNNVNVIYTRTSDVYETPAQKAAKANASAADYFVSIHRNASPYSNQYTGVESLVYSRYGAAAEMADNINKQLETAGFVNQGVKERPHLVVLNRTRMPAILVETGFINTDRDNMLFDSRFQETAQAVADGILMSL